MKHNWQLPESEAIETAPAFDPVETLLEFDGPALVTLDHGESRWLALIVDQDSERKLQRWLLAPLFSGDFTALVRGAVAVRSLFTRSELLVIDYDWRDMSALRVWRVDPTQVPETTLPEANALLPAGVRESFTGGEAA